MANPSSKALYSTCVACVGFVCFAVGATAVGLPLWGYFEDQGALAFRIGLLEKLYSRMQSQNQTDYEKLVKEKEQARIAREKGYFGPWLVCKRLSPIWEQCGPNAKTFEPIAAVYVAGVVAAIGVTFLGLFCVLSVIQMAMVTQRDKVVMKYSTCVVVKLVLATLATLLAMVSAGLFALQTDDPKNQYRVTRGESFYIQILLIILDFLLFIMSLYDVLFSRRLGGDPTISGRDPGGESATTFNNPHFRERSSKGSISMTDASGKPYVRSRSPNHNGSLASFATMTTTTSNGSSVTRSPLRSSLKKPKPPSEAGALGIHNPGFSQGSPTFQRNGSVKKVRIQTRSTAV